MVEHPVRKVVQALHDAAKADKVTFDTLLKGFGDAAYPPCLLVPALLMVSPLSGIPLFSSFSALVICLIAAQGAWGRDRIWLPQFLAQRALPAERLGKAAHALRHVVRISEYVTRPRLALLSSPAARRVIYGMIMLLAACVPVLELLPFASSLIGLIVTVLAIALLTRDGVVLIAGFALACGVVVTLGNLVEFFAT
ncbi:MAG: exopolysaccharide biosynthesis protein [Loktanella sp.]|nr:exopolysaccharide biosynthesis protein [Loktanella sp.]